jgi:hypothetical protein
MNQVEWLNYKFVFNANEIWKQPGSFGEAQKPQCCYDFPTVKIILWWIGSLLIGLHDRLVFAGSPVRQSGTVLLVLSAGRFFTDSIVPAAWCW